MSSEHITPEAIAALTPIRATALARIHLSTHDDPHYLAGREALAVVMEGPAGVALNHDIRDRFLLQLKQSVPQAADLTRHAVRWAALAEARPDALTPEQYAAMTRAWREVAAVSTEDELAAENERWLAESPSAKRLVWAE